MNDDTCRFGSECSFHFRIDALELDEETRELISYSGSYAIVTEVAPEVRLPSVQVAIAMGGVKPENMYVTWVGFLGGDENSLSDSFDDVNESEFYRYWVRHDSVDNLLEAHMMVVWAVANDMLDLSTGRSEEYFEECKANTVTLKNAISDFLDEELF